VPTAATAPATGIGFVEGMTISALSGSRALSNRTDAAQDILPACHNLHVCGIRTASIPTEVIDGEVIGDRLTHRKLPRDTMRLLDHLPPPRFSEEQVPIAT
jgi:hypothetical protein